MSTVPGLFLHCRTGFEGECAAEIRDRAAAVGVHGYCKAKPDSAYVLFQPQGAGDAARVHRQVPLAQLVFARQWFVALALRKDLPADDRIAPLLESLAGVPGPVAEVFLETPDTNQGKQLSALCRSLAAPLRRAMKAAGRLQPDVALRIHVCFLGTGAAYAGYADLDNSAPAAMGIVRLRVPRSAPSRSTLKLEEALLHFLSADERGQLLRPGMEAVDLGAAPGGWAWQLVRRHLRVTAVDNGAMDPRLLDSGLVAHRREDGFRYRPPHPVDWMVCDMVEQPGRIADLAARWIERGWCRHTVFNLKLPMKQRYRELRRCLEHIDIRLQSARVPYHMSCKQLYHDREEVTVCLYRSGRNE
ncbi:MAG: 23S rRNA (cytidine(2498)-2'-O)-methyltransferase RlmM [Gammaproteobacteria bacterium]